VRPGLFFMKRHPPTLPAVGAALIGANLRGRSSSIGRSALLLPLKGGEGWDEGGVPRVLSLWPAPLTPTLPPPWEERGVTAAASNLKLAPMRVAPASSLRQLLSADVPKALAELVHHPERLAQLRVLGQRLQGRVAAYRCLRLPIVLGE